MLPLINKNGITIKELKTLINSLPETDEYGDDYEIWIENTDAEGLSNPVKTIMQLNQGDLIFSKF
jgi:hypothetical protein